MSQKCDLYIWSFFNCLDFTCKKRYNSSYYLWRNIIDGNHFAHSYDVYAESFKSAWNDRCDLKHSLYFFKEPFKNYIKSIKITIYDRLRNLQWSSRTYLKQFLASIFWYYSIFSSIKRSWFTRLSSVTIGILYQGTLGRWLINSIPILKT